MSITKKFMLALGAIVFSGLLLTILMFYLIESRNVRAQAAEESELISQESLRLLGVIDVIMAERVKNSMTLLRDYGSALGEPTQGERVRVNEREVPDLFLGETAIANQFQLVDKLTSVMDGTATIFSRDGEDYVRISTNVMTPTGRAIGTVLAPQGAAIKSIQQGKPFYGLVDILGNPYLTGYEPIKDANSNTIGIWYVGYKADLQVLFSAVQKSRVLEKGFVAIRDNTGVIRVHSDGVTSEEVTAILTEDASGWTLDKKVFGPWQYEIITAYSNEEIDGIVTSALLKAAVIILLGGLVVMFIVYQLIQIVVAKPLHKTTERLNDIVNGEGDLTLRFNSRGKDELADLANGFDGLMNRLQSTINSVSQSTRQLFTSAKDLKHIATQSSESAVAQNQDINSIASAIYEMSTSAQQVANHADSVAHMADQAKSESDQGYNNLRETINSTQVLASNIEQAAQGIEALAGASNEIGAVLNVIRSIAEQTNLLALNAAIEAARAGEQGRGFAVVADEVRSLASRTQASTEEVDKMVKRFQGNSLQASERMRLAEGQVHKNVTAADDSGKSIQQVLSAVSDLSSLNYEISVSVREQSTVAEDISSNIMRINSNSEQNHQRVQETLQSAELVSRLAEEIQKQLSSYKV
ncbi:Cache 3/Cache 2 fusion domain-containing protein [Cellvibrio sp. NN19]|uniref:methyl-accepting chemotaxis protein n=1 Tax=Cellvibrio chitinivorans TaxID=3102792 RepID=UPI002B4139F9|nr:Cache 3/Cache 2 fusion domain-containing protein [Cellvibrio sp. NN19]